jgi:hypothetical protein
MSLHCEQECLGQVIRSADPLLLGVTPATQNLLDLYLRKATRAITRDETRVGERLEIGPMVHEYARQCLERGAPGAVDSLLVAVERLRALRNMKSNVTGWASALTNIQ